MKNNLKFLTTNKNMTYYKHNNFDSNDLFFIETKLLGDRKSLFDLATWKNGLAFKNIDFSNKGKPIIKIAELNNGISNNTAYTDKEYGSDVSLTYGDLVFSWSGNPQTSIDIFRYNLCDGWLNQHIFKVIPKDGIDRDFLFYIMKYLKPNLIKIATNKQTIGLGHVTLSDIKKISIVLPNKTVQKKIVSILKALDDKIELNNKINENLEQQAQALFNKYFPCINIGNNFIGNYIKVKRGKNLLSKDAVLGKVPVVAGGLQPATYHNVSNTGAPVITISASGANAGYINLWHIPVWSSDSSFIDNSVSENIYFWFVLLKNRQQEIYDSQTGSAQPHIYPQHIENLPIGDIDKKLVTKYNKIVSPLFKLIGENKIENEQLANLRNTLLPKLMNGEIDVEKIKI